MHKLPEKSYTSFAWVCNDHMARLIYILILYSCNKIIIIMKNVLMRFSLHEREAFRKGVPRWKNPRLLSFLSKKGRSKVKGSFRSQKIWHNSLADIISWLDQLLITLFGVESNRHPQRKEAQWAAVILDTSKKGKADRDWQIIAQEFANRLRPKKFGLNQSTIVHHLAKMGVSHRKHEKQPKKDPRNNCERRKWAAHSPTSRIVHHMQSQWTKMSNLCPNRLIRHM